MTGAMTSPHAFHTATLLGDGTVLVTGGLIADKIDGTVSAASEIYEPATGRWTATADMHDARWGHTASLLGDGRVLVAGSYVNSGDPLDSAEIYDPVSGAWSNTGPMTTGRGGQTATVLADGRVLVVGGGAEETDVEGGPRSPTAELYDAETGRWTATGNMVEARKGFTATLLPDGRVLVAGGDASFMSAEVYDPSDGRWASTGSMAQGRFGHTATLMPDGTVLVTGGCACSDPGAVASAESYDPATGRWTTTGSMATARIFHTATLLEDGDVLVVDDGLANEERPSAERYRAAAGEWVVTASPGRSRVGYAATRLANGQVLLTGDYDAGAGLEAELYDPGTGP